MMNLNAVVVDSTVEIERRLSVVGPRTAPGLRGKDSSVVPGRYPLPVVP